MKRALQAAAVDVAFCALAAWLIVCWAGNSAMAGRRRRERGC